MVAKTRADGISCGTQNHNLWMVIRQTHSIHVPEIIHAKAGDECGTTTKTDKVPSSNATTTATNLRGSMSTDQTSCEPLHCSIAPTRCYGKSSGSESSSSLRARSRAKNFPAPSAKCKRARPYCRASKLGVHNFMWCHAFGYAAPSRNHAESNPSGRPWARRSNLLSAFFVRVIRQPAPCVEHTA